MQLAGVILDKCEALPSMGSKKPKLFYGYIIVAAAFLITLIMCGTLFTFGVFFKPILTEFGWTRAMTSGAFSLCILLFGLLGIGTGRLTDRFGPRVVISGCGFFLGLGYLLMSQVSAIWQLYLFYGVMVGIGVSGSFVPLVSTVARWFAERRGMMTGIAVSGIGIGTMIMPLVANWLISSYGWRTSYIVVGITVLVLIILVAQFLRRDPGQMGQLPYGADEVKVESLNSGTRGFSFQEAIHTRQFWMLGVTLLCFGASLQVMMVHIVSYAIDLGVSATSAAVILAVIGGLSTGGRVIMGSAGDRIGNKLALIISFILMSAALFWLLTARELWRLYLFAVIFGFGYGGIATLVSLIVAEQFGLSSLGIILGAVTFSITIGEASGPIVAGHIFDITGSYNLAFLACAAISIIGIILSASLRPPSSQRGVNVTERSA